MADDTEYTESDIWASPSHDAPLATRPKTPKTPTGSAPASESVSRDDLLRRELEGVRSVNEGVEGLLGTLNRAGGNMQVVARTVANASTLLDTWTRILSQTEHNQRLILHPGWKGLTQDLAEQEAEALEKQRAAERKAAEEEQRREELRRRREEEETARRLAPSTSRGTRGLRRTRSRGGIATRSGTTGSRLPEPPTSSSSRSRGTSGIGRGMRTTRSRTRAAR
ncbi:DASH complex, subunit Duo1 [Metarhizium album ARSEF 1941]|uniref:DASH complex subunit DUO1 n=1 Tax=Metarhizium album (strain ARSEF 1941) TaxID=1081103 RepID=A0A0B2WYJ3_METAS|nr:DASH complex, subunit Duo1 [Metarhizium album ARSEF 1941]KHN99118.1 DASH complex, subunit Duo1 [Metarhizium album ARSEF 1941]